MVDSYTIGQNDHGLAITSTLEDSTGAAVNLTGASVTFVVMPLYGGSRIVNAAATIPDAVNGKVSYVWQAADTVKAGAFVGQWKVTFADGSVESFPNNDYIQVSITQSA